MRNFFQSLTFVKCQRKHRTAHLKLMLDQIKALYSNCVASLAPCLGPDQAYCRRNQVVTYQSHVGGRYAQIFVRVLHTSVRPWLCACSIKKYSMTDNQFEHFSIDTALYLKLYPSHTLNSVAPPLARYLMLNVLMEGAATLEAAVIGRQVLTDSVHALWFRRRRRR